MIPTNRSHIQFATMEFQAHNNEHNCFNEDFSLCGKVSHNQIINKTYGIFDDQQNKPSIQNRGQLEEAIWGLTTPAVFVENLICALLATAFVPSLPKASWIYFTRNDQNRPDGALILPSDPCLSKFLVAPQQNMFSVED